MRSPPGRAPRVAVAAVLVAVLVVIIVVSVAKAMTAPGSFSSARGHRTVSEQTVR